MDTGASHLQEDDTLDQHDGDHVLDEEEHEDASVSIHARRDGRGYVVTRARRYGNSDPTEVLRFNSDDKLLRIFPKTTSDEPQFNKITELQIHPYVWAPDNHSGENDIGEIEAIGLPKGFSAVYRNGLGLLPRYRGFVHNIQDHSPCTKVRFIHTGPEGPDNDGVIFNVTLHRFEKYRMAVERTRRRGRTAARRVIEAEGHNAVADLLGRDLVEPKYTKHEVIRALTEEAATGKVIDAADRSRLIDATAEAAPNAAREDPERFGRLRTDIELVSLEALVDRFEDGLESGKNTNEKYWQDFFNTNRFALQQLFSMPIIVEIPQATVRGQGPDGRGARITDFLCANSVTRTAVLVEIKTPATKLMGGLYRGRGNAEVFRVHNDLIGSIVQIQSQMADVPKHLSEMLRYSPQYEINTQVEVRGAVIAGRLSELSDEQQESFLRFREGFTGISILGYDEVLDRLKGLLTALKTSPSPNEDVVAAEQT